MIANAVFIRMLTNPTFTLGKSGWLIEADSLHFLWSNYQIASIDSILAFDSSTPVKRTWDTEEEARDFWQRWRATMIQRALAPELAWSETQRKQLEERLLETTTLIDPGCNEAIRDYGSYIESDGEHPAHWEFPEKLPNIPALLNDVQYLKDEIEDLKGSCARLREVLTDVRPHPDGAYNLWLARRDQVLHDKSGAEFLQQLRKALARNKYLETWETGSVLQTWVMVLPRREQGTLLTAVRGCDLVPKLPLDSNARKLVACIRGAFLVPADPREVDSEVGSFMSYLDPPQFKWSELGHYPQHWVSHILHAIEVLGYRHPDTRKRGLWLAIYQQGCHSLHVVPENVEQFELRMSEDRIAKGTVVS